MIKPIVLFTDIVSYVINLINYFHFSCNFPLQIELFTLDGDSLQIPHLPNLTFDCHPSRPFPMNESPRKVLDMYTLLGATKNRNPQE